MGEQNLLSLGEYTLSAVPRRSCLGREHKVLAASDKGPSCLFPVLPGAHPPDVEAQAPPLLLWRLVVGPGQVDGRAVDQRKLLQGFHVLAAGTQHGTQEPAIQVRISLQKFAFVHGTIFSLARTNDEAAQQERRRLGPHVWRISIEKEGRCSRQLGPFPAMGRQASRRGQHAKHSH